MKLATIILICLILTSCSNQNLQSYDTYPDFGDLNKDVPIQDGIVQLVIKPEYEHYPAGQDIWIKATLINNSNEDFYITYRLDWYFLNLRIYDPDNEYTNSGTTLDYGYPIDSTLVPPGQSYSDIINISDWFLGGIEHANKIKRGVYKISASYDKTMGTIPLGIDKSKYKPPPIIKSNVIKIEIHHPEGTDKEAYNYYFNKDTDFNNIAEKHEYIIDKFPDSKYLPQFYGKVLFELSNGQDSVTLYQTIEDFFNNPNSTYEAFNIMNRIERFTKLNYDKTYSDLKRYYFELSERFKNSKIGESIDIWIRNIEFIINVNQKLKLRN